METIYRDNTFAQPVAAVVYENCFFTVVLVEWLNGEGRSTAGSSPPRFHVFNGSGKYWETFESRAAAVEAVDAYCQGLHEQMLRDSAEFA